MNSLYLVRHGQSEWTRVGRIQGRTETPLTDVGREQARVLGCLLAQVLTDTTIPIVASPLSRALDTALIIADVLGRPGSDVNVDGRLTDFDVGNLAGSKGWDAVAAEDPELARLRLEDPLRFHPSGGESGADALARAGDFLVDCENRREDLLVVSHGVTTKFIRAARFGFKGADIIAQGEAQDCVYQLRGLEVIEHQAES